MISPEDLVPFLRLNYVAQSIETLRPELPRWVRQLEERGVRAVPDLRLQHQWTLRDVLDANEINHVLANARPGKHDRKTAHDLRNLMVFTGNPIRPYHAQVPYRVCAPGALSSPIRRRPSAQVSEHA